MAAKGSKNTGSEPRRGPETPPENLLKPALRLLSLRARTVKELKGRLLEKGFPPGDVSHCVGWLKERDLLNDAAFARAFIRDRLRFSPRSAFFLERELARKGVHSSLAKEVVEEVLDDEEVTEGKLAAQAAEGWVLRQSARTRGEFLRDRFSPKREKIRRRLYGFLSRRGFRGEAARIGLEAGEEKARELEE